MISNHLAHNLAAGSFARFGYMRTSARLYFRNIDEHGRIFVRLDWSRGAIASHVDGMHNVCLSVCVCARTQIKTLRQHVLGD